MRSKSEPEGGTALVWALLFVVLTATMIVSHTTFMHANRRTSDVRYRERTLSKTFARSGLTDALAWFQRQPIQPVTSFAPQFDPSGNPPFFDTEDSALGLVRAFQIRGNLWGRYEVRRAEAGDISGERGQSQAGSVWALRSRGIVYWRHDPNAAFNASPNRVIASETATTELRGIPATPPANAALLVDDIHSVTVLTDGEITGGSSPAVAFPPPGLLPAVDASVTGTPAHSSVAGYDASVERVFGMPIEILSDFSNLVIEAKYAAHVAGTYFDATAMLPNRRPKDAMVIIRGDTSIPAGRSLRGRGVYLFDGNVRFEPNNDSQLEGIVYVQGDAEIRGPFQLRGAMIVRGSVTLGGTAGDKVELIYDQATLDGLRRTLHRYRASRIRSR